MTDAEVLLDVVALEQAGSAKAALEDLADAAEGRVIDADPDALRKAFTEEADALARQVLVTAELPESVTSDEASVSVSLPTDDATLVADAFAAVRAGVRGAVVLVVHQRHPRLRGAGTDDPRDVDVRRPGRCRPRAAPPAVPAWSRSRPRP